MYRKLLAVVAIFIVTLTVVDRCHRRSVSEWESRAAQVEGQLWAEVERAEALKQEATFASERADSLADALENRAPEIRERIIRVQAETPADIRDHPAVVSRDSIITDLRIEADGWRSAFESQRAAFVTLEGALTVVESSRDSLAAILEAQPNERPWFLPRLGIGPFAGVCPDGRVCAGPVGVTVSWEVKL